MPSPVPSPTSPSKPRVLICDDDLLTRRLILDRLGEEFECVSVASAEEALPAALAMSPELILSDMVMPGKSGLELCRTLRALSSFSAVPIVLLTAAHADDETRAAVFEAGADDYLVKPIGPRELLMRVRSLVKLMRARQQLVRRTEELEASNATLRQAQGALVQTEKLATLGTLVAGIAHEINNPLAYMKSGSAQLADLAAEIDENLNVLEGTVPAAARTAVTGSREVVTEIRDVGREIAEGAARLARIAADLKTFSSTATGKLESVDLLAEVRRAWSMASLQAARKPRLSVLQTSPVTITAQSHHIGQVLLNVNAVHALEKKAEEGEVRVWISEEFDQVSLHIQDNGAGIAEEHLPRIFDPFFTTKPPGKGTGLGLSVSFALVRSMGGLIEARSPPGHGALFVIHLPKEGATDDYNATRMGRPPSRSVLQFVPRPPSKAVPGR
jgi:two-component system NtrC family sensor kinase